MSVDEPCAAVPCRRRGVSSLGGTIVLTDVLAGISVGMKQYCVFSRLALRAPS